jgi:hypothetical protein
MPQLLKLLRRLPVKEDPKDIATFINRELLPFLQEIRDSFGSDLEQIPTDTLLGRDTDGIGAVENISLDDTLEFTGSRIIQRAEITGDVEIPAGSNESTIPAFETGFVVQGSTGLLPNEYVGTTSAQIAWDFSVPGQVTLSIVPGSVGLDDLEDIPYQTVLGNDSGGDGPPEAITVHQELDWIGGAAVWTFDGVDDRIDFGNNFSKERTDAFSLGIWFITTDGDGCVVGKTLQSGTTRRGYELLVGPTSISFGLANNAAGGANNIVVRNLQDWTDGILHYVLITYNGSSLASGVDIYVDGVAVAKSTIVDTLSQTTLSAAIFTIGARDGAANVLFAGTLSHAQLWNRVLTAPEVAEAYNGGDPPDLLASSMASALQHWVILDENDTTGAGGVADHSTSNIDGTAEGSLAPTSLKGSLATRGTSLWELIQPHATSGLPLASNGTNALPSYQRIPLTGLATITGPTILGLQTGTATVDTLTGGEAGHLIKKAVSISVTIGADQHNFSPANFATADHVFVSTSGGDYSITGFQSSVFAELAGTEFVLWCTSTGSITFVNNSGSSSAGNRLVTPTIAGSTFRISQNEAVKFRYVGSQWYALPHAPLLTGQLMGNRLQRGNVISATVSGTTHNWSPANLVTADTIEITLTGNSTITGIDSSVFNVGGATASGREIILHNIDSTDTLTLPTNTGSSVGNCFHSRAPNRSVTLGPGQCALVRKEGSFWVPRVLDGALADDETIVNISGALGNGQPRALSLMAGGHLTYDATNHRFDLANVTSGTIKGRQIDASTPGAVVDLTGQEVGEIVKFDFTQEILAVAPGDYTSASFGTTLAAIDSRTTTLHMTVSAAGDVNIHGLPENTGRRIVFKKRSATGRIVFIPDSATEVTVGSRFETPAAANIALVNTNDSLEFEDQFSRWRPLSYTLRSSASIINVEGEFQRAALTGDVTATQNSNATTIANDAVTNAKAANMAESTIKLRAAGAGTGDPTDGTIQQALAMLGTARAGNQIVHNGVEWTLVDELLTEEFYTFSSASAEGEWNWFAPFGGSFGVIRIDSHPGVVTFSTGPGGLLANFASTTADGSSDRGEILAEDIAFFRVVCRIRVGVSSANFGIGMCFYDSSAGSGEFSGTTPNLGGEGVALFCSSAGGVWSIRREDAGSGATTGFGVTPVAEEWVEAVFIQTSAGTWNCYLDGVSVATGVTGGPVGSQLGPVVWMDNDHGSENRDWEVDLFQIGLRFTNTRHS